MSYTDVLSLTPWWILLNWIPAEASTQRVFILISLMNHDFQQLSLEIQKCHFSVQEIILLYL